MRSRANRDKYRSGFDRDLLSFVYLVTKLRKTISKFSNWTRHKFRVFVSELLLVRQVSGYLPGCVVLPEVAKSRLKPCVDIAQSELVIRRLNNGLKEQRTKKQGVKC